MKNTKIMAVLAIFLATLLFVGAASAVNVTVVTDPSGAAAGVGLGAGTYTLQYPTGTNLSTGITFTNMDYASGTLTTSANGAIAVLATDFNGVYKSNNIVGGDYYYFKVVDCKDVPLLPINAKLNATKINVTESVAFEYTVNVADATLLTVDFGDGTILENTTTLASGATGKIEHQYTKAGTFTVTYSVASATYPKDNEYVGTVEVNPVREVVVGSGVAFVYEQIYLDTGDTTLYFLSNDNTPAVLNTLTANGGVFNLLEASINGNYGVWYTTTTKTANTVTIWYPEIVLKAELTTGLNGATSGDSIDGKTINKNTEVSFIVEAPKVGQVSGLADVKIVFTTPAGGKTTQFGGEDFSGISLSQVKTIAKNTGVEAGDDAAAGTWTAQAEFTSPSGFSDNAKKTNTVSFTLQSTTLVLTAAKDSVVRSNPFTVSIQGDSKKVYFIYLDGASASDVNPTLQPSQSGMLDVNVMTVATNNGQSVVTDAYDVNIKDTWAYFETDASGKRMVQYNTAANTEDKTYTVKVYATNMDKTTALTARTADVKGLDYDSVKVKVEKGAVTITASGDGSYYIGDEIKLTGTNTDSDNIFLFLTGQNLIENGIVLKDLPTKTAAKFGMNQKVAVKTDDTWEFKWDTSKIALDTGAYTIYATSKITNGKSSTAENVTIDGGLSYYTAFKLSDSEYATVSINLKQPFLSAVPSGTIVAKGDKIYIRGTAEGDPSNLRLYIFGPNFFDPYTITVEDDGSYEKKIDIPSTMSSNQYFVVVQHPMYNNEFDAYLDSELDPEPFSMTTTYQWAFKTNSGNTGGDMQSFIVWGSANKLQGSQAADALTKMIDSANIDDIYTKLTFTVAEPWIKITNPGDQATGSKFTISGTTNLAVDDQILVEVMSSSFSAVDKTSTSTTSGVSQTTKVIAGEGTDNTWSVEVDTTNWKLDEYTIKVQGIEVDVTTTTNFNLVEKVVTTTPTTAVPTGATPTATTAKPTETPKTPGFGAFIALAGLGAVALLVLRRN